MIFPTLFQQVVIGAEGPRDELGRPSTTASLFRQPPSRLEAPK
jgi:hypothetical protein